MAEQAESLASGRLRPGRILTPGTWIGGIAVTAAAAGTRLWAGSPVALIHSLGRADTLPPLWLMGLLWLSAFFLFGCTAGTVLTGRTGGPVLSAWRFRGGMYFLLSVMPALMWYPLLFSASLLWLSLVCLCVSAGCAAVCGLCWLRVSRLSLVTVGLYLFWTVFLFFLQLFTLLAR